MAVLFGGAVAAVVTIGAAAVYDDHSDHSDYSDYDNYSDAAERKKRRIAALKGETSSAAEELVNYKQFTVNPKLDSSTLKRKPAMRVSQSAMDDDAKSKIQRQADAQISKETKDEQAQLEEIEALLRRIEEIQKEERQ